jgi:hypothetical protein
LVIVQTVDASVVLWEAKNAKTHKPHAERLKTHKTKQKFKFVPVLGRFERREVEAALFGLIFLLV